ncbi:G-protein coupled receptor GRL101-like protein [Trichoplax sp. H2]|nr:G-protein coupled receptor GRL101-like protein [Trichoplax sp. H2]|eukprot:RDD39575.1 G-protein coupled receptor GRL101-like protein [Trichoplax sp. H2]
MASLLYNNYVAISTSWVVGLGGIIGNISIIFAIVIHNQKVNRRIFARSISSQSSRLAMIFKSRTFKILLLNLAISDLLGAIYLITIGVAELYHRNVVYSAWSNESIYYNSSYVHVYWQRSPVCYLARCCNILASLQSIFVTTLIATDRYLNVAYPHSNKRFTPKRTVMLVIIGWFTSASITIMFSIYAYITENQSFDMRFHFYNLCTYDNIGIYFIRIHVFTIAIVAFILYLYIVSMYILIIYKLIQYRRNSEVRLYYPSPIQRKLIRLAILISLTNFLVWFPAIGVGVAAFTYYNGILKVKLVFDVTSTLIFIFQANCIINPIIFWLSISNWL